MKSATDRILRRLDLKQIASGMLGPGWGVSVTPNGPHDRVEIQRKGYVRAATFGCDAGLDKLRVWVQDAWDFEQDQEAKARGVVVNLRLMRRRALFDAVTAGLTGDWHVVVSRKDESRDEIVIGRRCVSRIYVIHKDRPLSYLSEWLKETHALYPSVEPIIEQIPDYIETPPVIKISLGPLPIEMPSFTVDAVASSTQTLTCKLQALSPHERNTRMRDLLRRSMEGEKDGKPISKLGNVPGVGATLTIYCEGDDW